MQQQQQQLPQQQNQPDIKVNIKQEPQQMTLRNNRKVISSTSGPGTNIKVTVPPPGPVSHTVVVDNLTASTSKDQLYKMARQVGEVEVR